MHKPPNNGEIKSSDFLQNESEIQYNCLYALQMFSWIFDSSGNAEVRLKTDWEELFMA